MHRILIVTAATALLAVGCGQPAQTAVTSTATKTVTSVSTTVKVLSGDELFKQRLNDGGVMANDDQVASLTPLAQQTCKTINEADKPQDEKYANMVYVLMEINKLRRASNIFDDESTTKVFLTATIQAYCPQYLDLIPAS